MSQDAPRTSIDGQTLGLLFQNLTPLVKEPSGFSSKATAVCTTFGLDPVTSKEVVELFKNQFVPGANKEQR